MLIIEMKDFELTSFEPIIKTNSENFFITKCKNFGGSSELVEVLVVLTPVILTSIIGVLREIMNYKLSKKKSSQYEESEITVKVKNQIGDAEIVLKTSAISNVAELEAAIDNVLKKIDKLQSNE